jgi:CheY-like chemotaxis protein
MRVLCVEDDVNWIEDIRPSLKEVTGEPSVCFAESRDSAIQALGTGMFDIIILDLKIPTIDGRLDADTAHGRALYEAIRQSIPGTPIVFLTGFATEDFYEDMLAQAETLDVWGSGCPFPMLRVIRKSRLPDLLSLLQGVRQEIERIDAIEINCVPGSLVLNDAERRLLRVFGRRQHAGGVVVSELGGGLGALRVLKVDLSHVDGRMAPFVAAKIGDRAEIAKERVAYTQYIVHLKNGTYSALIEQLSCGAGALAGVFYRLLDGYETTLFKLLQEDRESAAQVVLALEAYESPWVDNVAASEITIGAVRRSLVSDEVLEQVPDISNRLPGWREFENKRIRVRWCCQHRDLHGGNVLLDSDLNPTLIDFGAVGHGPAALDPITLELSLMFHPTGRAASNGWPTLVQAERWAEGAPYFGESPFPSFIEAVRAWADSVAVGRREILATAYAYCARQLKYRDTDADLAIAVMRSAIGAYSQT